MALNSSVLLLNNRTGYLVSRLFLQLQNGNSAQPSICFTDSPDSGLFCDSSGLIKYAKNGADQGELIGANVGVVSDTTGITGADRVRNIVSLTQAEYNAIISPAADTFYIITP